MPKFGLSFEKANKVENHLFNVQHSLYFTGPDPQGSSKKIIKILTVVPGLSSLELPLV